MRGTGARMNELLVAAGLEPVDAATTSQFEAYISLILRWNARLNLTAVRDEDGVISRHLIESIMVARVLPMGITTLLDFGSGAGLPGIPIALCRTEIEVTLVESQGKKAAFLGEAVRSLGLSAKVYAARAETLTQKFDCVAMRAVDRMTEAVRVAARLVTAGCWLALMTTHRDLDELKWAAGIGFDWGEPTRLPGSTDRIVAQGKKQSA